MVKVHLLVPQQDREDIILVSAYGGSSSAGTSAGSSTSGNGSTQKPLSNIGVSSAKGNQSVVEFLSGIEEERVELDGAEYDATVAFFTSRDYDLQSAQSLAYVLMKQAKADNVNIFTVLDTLKPSDPVQLSQLVTEVLNAYRYKTSVLGYKNDRTAQSHVSRNIKA